jgi:hypothetical protein
VDVDDRTVPEKAIDEIKEVLARHNCAGLVVVCDETDVAFVRRIDPPWSCAWMEPVPGDTDGRVAVRIRSKLVDYPGDTEAEKKANQKLQVEATTGMFMAFMGWADETFQQMTQITAMLAKHYPEILHHEKWRRGKW